MRLILVDAEMPEMDGYVLTKHIKADSRFDGILPAYAFFLVFGSQPSHGQAVGVDAYVAKFDAEILMTCARYLSDRKEFKEYGEEIWLIQN